MNTMGKILVFVNFFFALVIGGFMVIDFARRTNWRAAFDNANAQLRIAHNNTETLAESNRKVLAEVNKLSAALANQERKAKAEADDLRNKLAAEKNSRSVSEQNSNKLLAQYNDAVAESKRRAEEIANLGKAIKSRDQTIVALEEDRSKLKAEAIGALNNMANAQERNMSLLAQVREQQKELYRLSNSAGSAVKGATTRRPPLNFVKGAIERLDPKDKSLVQLNVGSDQGLAEGNTLEVYRLKPNPEYLGTLVIVDARPHQAVARLLPSEFRSRRTELRVGDEVASKLSR
jgi:hypothetical protein